MSNKKFVIFYFFLFGVFIYCLIGLLGILDFNKNKNNLFKTKDNLDFHQKFSKKLHHLRDSNRWGKKKNDYLYTEIGKSKNGTHILLQGDSWMEQVLEINSSFSLFKDFSEIKNLKIINAGITSYSPTLMNLQYQILKENFGIKPETVVIYIDQTDIGDEICRYNPSKVFNNNTLIGVKKEFFTNKIYDYTKIYSYSEINFINNFPLKFLRLANFKIKYFFIRSYNRFHEIAEVGWKNRGSVKCRFSEIQKYLFNLDKNSKDIFINSIKNYLKVLEEDKNVKNILIVTFPHFLHLKGEYNVNVSFLIDDLLEINNFYKISHLNFSKLNFSKINYENIYIDGDPSSHLNNEYHSKLFVKGIIKEIQQIIKK